MTWAKFQELKIGEGFNPGFAHIIEGAEDMFPDRPWGDYMKTGENKAIWLRNGNEREFNPRQSVRRVKLIIKSEPM